MKTSHFYIILTLLTVLQSYSPIVRSQELQFYREDIVFSANENQVTTDAHYYFCNPGEKKIRTTLFYPLPDIIMEQIDSLVIWNLNTQEIIPYRTGRSGIFFGISVAAYGEAAFRVFFSQWLVEKKFKYILTSTETWDRSLGYANIELQAPIGLSIDYLSYPPDSTFNKNEIQYYFWKKKDFIPEKDFVLELK